MKPAVLACALSLLLGFFLTQTSFGQSVPDWGQWGRVQQHSGATGAHGQSPTRKLADITFDPFTTQEKAESFGELLIHYQVPLIDGKRVLLEVKTGKYVSCDPPGSGVPFPCGPDAWNQQIWNERAYTWQNGRLVQAWNFRSDWKPAPNHDGFGGWEPVFHAALINGSVFVPGFGGSIYKLNEADGTVVTHYRPFGAQDDPFKFVAGPLTVDHAGNVYYTVIALDKTLGWDGDTRGSWLVRITPQGNMGTVKFSTLVPDAPTTCDGDPCGSQRPAMNAAPAIANDGKTIYIISRAQFFLNYAYVVAVNANLTPKWHTSLRNQIPGVDGWVTNLSSSTPAVAPDGSILFGALSSSSDRGSLFKLSSAGKFLATYDFGWDETPAIYAHDGTYSVILKDNFYDTGGPFYITQLDANLVPEWRYQNPSNREWCVNAPAVDADGTVYANSEDGSAYVINQGGTLKGKMFLLQAIGSAYTPVAVGKDGKIYAENNGDMFVIGN
jgi:outer membrane protein assembly factor BamB